MRFRPDRYQCPVCNWDFGVRKKRCCRGCGTLLLIPSDVPSDDELRALKSFWIWDPLQQKWKYTLDWEEHKREMIERIDPFRKQRLSPPLEGGPDQPLRSRRIQ
jgi:hypothetical protein